MKIKLHISPCPNDTFMFDALINGRIECPGLEFEVEYHDIEELNSAALRAEADVSKISCAILPFISKTYTLCNSGAALGRGNGPLLVRRRGDKSPIHRIAVPGLRTTANTLIIKLFPDIKERTPRLFSQIAENVESGEFDAGVLIHEGRFVYQRRNLELVADLGLLWEERTGLPLPLGGIALSNRLSPEVKNQITNAIHRSIAFAFANPYISREYIKQHAQELEDSVIDSHISLFVNEYSLELGEEGHRAVEMLIGE